MLSSYVVDVCANVLYSNVLYIISEESLTCHFSLSTISYMLCYSLSQANNKTLEQIQEIQ
jgi:hypothetical protein